MSAKANNIHATTIRINKTGLCIVGPSGSGKSELAFSMLTEAKRCGADCALISDDQSFIRIEDGKIFASGSTVTKGLIELRGSAIVDVSCEDEVEVTMVVTPHWRNDEQRLPPADERYFFSETHSLPLLRIPPHSLTPYGKFCILVEQLCKSGHLSA